MCLQVGFVIFWRKDFGTKATHLHFFNDPEFSGFPFFFSSKTKHFSGIMTVEVYPYGNADQVSML
jgi:hypothetical protein